MVLAAALAGLAAWLVLAPTTSTRHGSGTRALLVTASGCAGWGVVGGGVPVPVAVAVLAAMLVRVAVLAG